MASKAEGKAILESTLGRLLGFDDGAGDLLEHLLTIESKEDLLEYLSQLLGDETPEVSAFVDNMGRFSRGEPLALITATVDDVAKKAAAGDNTKPNSTSPAENGGNNNQSQKQQQQQSKAASKKAALDARRSGNKNNNNNNNQGKNKSRVPPPKKKAPPPASATAASEGKSAKDTGAAQSDSSPAAESKPQQTKEERVVEKSRPTKGKATVVCGCFGTKHKPLTNCLYCGRISCVEEGFDFCAFCGYMVEEIKDETNGNDPSWVRKERLLRYDRDFARRTEIFDDQADYQAPAMWMTEEEREQAEENQARQLEALKRPKQTLNLAI